MRNLDSPTSDASDLPIVPPVRSEGGVSLDCKIGDRVLVGSDALTYRLNALTRHSRWSELSELLTTVDGVPELRGGTLMKALNIPLGARHRLFPMMIFQGAPADLIERTIEMGAAPAVDVMIRDPRSGERVSVTSLHLAMLLERTDLIPLLLKHRHRASALNGMHETAAEQYARVADKKQIRSEECAMRLGALVSRELREGVAAEHIVGLLRTLCTRKAWTAAEMVIDALLSGPERSMSELIPRASLSEIGWDSVMRRAPETLLSALIELGSSQLSIGSYSQPINASRAFVVDNLPGAKDGALLNEKTWEALQKKLSLLERVAPLVAPGFIATLLNSSYNALLKFDLTDELVVLGVEDPPSMHGVWSAVHAMVHYGAPLSLIEQTAALGADLSLQAVVEENDKVLIDGNPLHMVCNQRRLDMITPLLRLGAPADQINQALEVPLHTLFRANADRLDLNHIPAIAALLQAGSPIENTSRSGTELARMKIGVLSLKRAVELAYEYDEWSHGAPPPKAPVIEAIFPILERGQVVEVGESKVHAIVMDRLKMKLGGRAERAAKVLYDTLELEVVLEEKPARAVIEALHHALMPQPLPEEPPPAEPEAAPPAEEDSDPRWSEPTPDELDYVLEGPEEDSDLEDSHWLDLPDFSKEFSDRSYDEEPSEEDIVDEQHFVDRKIESKIPEPPAEPVPEPVADAPAPPEAESLSVETELIAPETATPQAEPAPAASMETRSLEEIALEALFEADEAVEIELEFTEITTEEDIAAKDDSTFELEDVDDIDEISISLEEGGVSLLTPSAGVELAALIAASDGSWRGSGHYMHMIYQFLSENSPHEAYILLEALNEVTANALTPFHATTRALRTLLFRSPPGTANLLGQMLDGMAPRNNQGYHPYMAEYLALMNHPSDEQRDATTIGGLTLGITSVAQLMHYGEIDGHLAGVLGRMGTLSFSFPFWRWDAQSFGPHGRSLLEMGGFTRIHHPATEFWNNPETGKKEHYMGPAFVAEPRGNFHHDFNNTVAYNLGYAPLDRETLPVLRRAGLFISHPKRGVIFVKNSSHEFGRDRLSVPALFCPDRMKVDQIVALTPKDIEQRFMSMTGADFFEAVATPRIHGHRRSRASAKPSQPFVDNAEWLLDQFHTVRVGYGRKKFDTHIPTAWNGNELMGGYYSQLFQPCIELCAELFEKRAKDGKTIVPDLTMNNPDYPPLAPHARIAITERSLGVLMKLAEGRIKEIKQRDLEETGIDKFLANAFHRGKNSELTFLLPE